MNRLSKGEATEPAHLEGYAYEDYGDIESRQQAACALWHGSSSLVQQLLEELYRLDDTPGIPLPAAQTWRKQAEQLFSRL